MIAITESHRQARVIQLYRKIEFLRWSKQVPESKLSLFLFSVITFPDSSTFIYCRTVEKQQLSALDEKWCVFLIFEVDVFFIYISTVLPTSGKVEIFYLIKTGVNITHNAMSHWQFGWRFRCVVLVAGNGAWRFSPSRYRKLISFYVAHAGITKLTAVISSISFYWIIMNILLVKTSKSQIFSVD